MRYGLSSETIGRELRGDKEWGNPGPDGSLTYRAGRVLVLAEQATSKTGSLRACVRTEHILLGLLLEGDNRPAQVLRKHGLTPQIVREAIESGGV
jgi:ATP-dependent Clp protease ATP-binding subunit ClpA